MSSSETDGMDGESAAVCGEWSHSDLAVTGKLGVGVGCPWSPTYPTAYIHGTMQVKDRTDVGHLGFLINSLPPTYPLLSASTGVAAQLNVIGSLCLVAPPVGAPIEGPARLVIDGQPDPSGTDLVPLQLWRSSDESVLNVIDAKGSLGIGTQDPAVPLDVAGNSHVGGSLSIGVGNYSHSLTIQGTFSEQIEGTFSGQANLEKIDGYASAFRVGDFLQIVADGTVILTTQKLNIFQVKTIAGDEKSFTVVVPPATNFNDAAIFVDQPPLSINNGTGAPLFSINRYGNINAAATLEVSGDTTIGGVLNGTGIVREAQIANAAVTQAKLAAGAVSSDKVVDGSITQSKLAGGAVGAGQIADGSVTQTKLAGGAVGTNQIADGSITQVKLGGGSVGTAQIADGSVILSKLGANSVGTIQIVDNSITVSKLADNSVTTPKIAAKSVTMDKLSVSTIAGMVEPSGTRYNGLGFTSKRISTGIYEIAFTPPLAGVQGASATQIYPWPMKITTSLGDTRDNAVIVYLAHDIMRVATGSNTGALDNRAFTFVVLTQ